MEAVNNYNSDDDYPEAAGGGSDSEDGEVDTAMDAALTNGRIVTDALTKFNLAAPASPVAASTTYLNVHLICETASRLLFLSVHWVKAIPAFALLR